MLEPTQADHLPHLQVTDLSSFRADPLKPGRSWCSEKYAKDVFGDAIVKLPGSRGRLVIVLPIAAEIIMQLAEQQGKARVSPFLLPVAMRDYSRELIEAYRNLQAEKEGA